MPFAAASVSDALSRSLRRCSGDGPPLDKDHGRPLDPATGLFVAQGTSTWLSLGKPTVVSYYHTECFGSTSVCISRSGWSAYRSSSFSLSAPSGLCTKVRCNQKKMIDTLTLSTKEPPQTGRDRVRCSFRPNALSIAP